MAKTIKSEEEIREILTTYFNGLDESSNPVTTELKNLKDQDSEAQKTRCEMFENQIGKLFDANTVIKLKVIPSFVNLILKLEITQQNAAKNHKSVTYNYCVNVEQLALLEPGELESRDYISNNLTSIKDFLTPIYTKKEIDTDTNYPCRVNLLPFYEKGTLMKFCGYESLLSLEEFEKYKKDYQLKALRYQYFDVPHGSDNHLKIEIENNTKFDVDQLQAIYDSPIIMHQTYLAARNDIFCSQDLSANTKNIINYFQQLLTNYNTILSENHNFQQTNLQQFPNETEEFYLERLQNYFQPRKNETPENYLLRMDNEVYALYNVLQSEVSECSYTLPADIIRAQQEKLFEKMGELLYLATILHREGLQYDDLKPENILINKIDKSEISDKKTLRRFNPDGKITKPTHLTYYPPEYDSMKVELNKQEAQAMTVYQLGAMFYNMVISLSAHDIDGQAHFIDKERIRLGLSDEFDFTHPQFQTELGQAFKQLIKLLVSHDQQERLTLDTACVRYNQLKKAMIHNNYYEYFEDAELQVNESKISDNEIIELGNNIAKIPTPLSSDVDIISSNNIPVLNNYPNYSDYFEKNKSLKLDRKNKKTDSIKNIKNNNSINDEPAPKPTCTASFFASPKRVGVTVAQGVSTVIVATLTGLAITHLLQTAPVILGASTVFGGPIGAGIACGCLLLMLGGLLTAASAAKMMSVDRNLDENRGLALK